MVRRFRSRPRFLPVCLLSVLLFALSSIHSLAQHLGGLEIGLGTLSVHVVANDNQRISQSMRVRLLGGGGATPMAEGYTDTSGIASFSGLNAGTYHIVVTGQGYEDTDGGTVQLDGQRASDTVFVRVRPAAKGAAGLPGSAKDATVDVSRLKVPKKALQEFDKGNGFLTQQQWAKAAEHFRKAIVIDPDFVDAYNNLGVAYARMNDRESEREALDRALKLNSHSVQALVNRARLALQEKDPSAESLLMRATAVEPRNPEILMLLAKVQLFSGEFKAAVETAQRIHLLPHGQFAISHYLAARALESLNRPNDAKAELGLFLQEESKGPRADAARKEIGLLESGGLPLAAGNE